MLSLSLESILDKYRVNAKAYKKNYR